MKRALVCGMTSLALSSGAQAQQSGTFSTLQLTGAPSSNVQLAIGNGQTGLQSSLTLLDGNSAIYQIGKQGDTHNSFFIYDIVRTRTFLEENSSGNVILQSSGGVVGIGTEAPCATSPPANCLLSVNGGIQAKEVVVNAGWSDYVFAPEYRLATLTEVADYVRENHHLPDIPSAREVQEKGVSIGEMQAKLLAKIEELTLHMIQAERESADLRRENAVLAERVERMERASGRALR
jgi:hypothetical protein